MKYQRNRNKQKTVFHTTNDGKDPKNIQRQYFIQRMMERIPKYNRLVEYFGSIQIGIKYLNVPYICYRNDTLVHNEIEYQV